VLSARNPPGGTTRGLTTSLDFFLDTSATVSVPRAPTAPSDAEVLYAARQNIIEDRGWGLLHSVPPLSSTGLPRWIGSAFSSDPTTAAASSVEVPGVPDSPLISMEATEEKLAALICEKGSKEGAD